MAYLGLSVYLTLSFHRSVPAVWLLVATLATLVWAVMSVLGAFDATYQPFSSLAETLRSGAWIAFMVSLLSHYWRLSEKIDYAFILSIGVWFVFGFLLLMDALVIGGWLQPDPENAQTAVGYFMFGRLISAIGALALLENLYRSTPKNGRWEIRPLCIALAAMLVFDIYMYAEATLFRSLDAGLFNARGAVQAICMPLIAITAARTPTWTIEIQLSRRIVFHTVSLVVTGIYLVSMSLAGLYLKRFGGTWGDVLQITFLFLAFVTLAIFVMSGTVRARARVLLQKHFFLHKYDYREEWLRFIRTVSGTGVGDDLDRRVVEATCDILDAPGGALWLKGDDGHFSQVLSWNYSVEDIAREEPDSPLIKFMQSRQWIINLNEVRKGDPKGEYPGVPMPDWAEGDDRPWVIMPLFHHERLIGFIVVVQPRAPRSLNWEDHDLLKTIGRQAASYIAERQSQEALSQAAEFDAFNRRFAFIMHDLKNLVSQLGLLSRNAEKHMDNPEFRQDMLSTLNSSVEKMNKMLAALNQQIEGQKKGEAVDVRHLLQNLGKEKPQVRHDLTDKAIWVKGQGEQLEQVFTHLIQNAIDASPKDGPVYIGVETRDGWAHVSVRDQGCGMSEEFVKKELFRPFRSTKLNGFGIGAFECRELVKAMGGRIDVKSRLGEGTEISVVLPLGEGPTAPTA